MSARRLTLFQLNDSHSYLVPHQEPSRQRIFPGTAWARRLFHEKASGYEKRI